MFAAIGRWLDGQTQARRVRESAVDVPRLRSDALELMSADGLGPRWRMTKGRAHGERLDGSAVVLSEAEFVERFCEVRS